MPVRVGLFLFGAWSGSRVVQHAAGSVRRKSDRIIYEVVISLTSREGRDG